MERSEHKLSIRIHPLLFFKILSTKSEIRNPVVQPSVDYGAGNIKCSKQKGLGFGILEIGYCLGFRY